MTTNTTTEDTMTTCERCNETVDHTANAVVGDLNSAFWCDDCLATTDDVWSACAHCGMDVVTAGVPSGRVYCADCTATGTITFTGNRIINALATAGLRGSWENAGGGCMAVVADVTYAGGVYAGRITIGNSATTMVNPDASMGEAFVTVEDAAGDYFAVDGWEHDASDAEYCWAECLTMHDLVVAVEAARDAIVARAHA